MVYVGGIGLLFLFVIIMLNLKTDYNKNKTSFSLLSGSTVLFFIILKVQNILALQMQYATQFLNSDTNMQQILKKHHFFSDDLLSFGLLLYTHYFFYFFLSGAILLISMVGVLVLSLNSNGEKYDSKIK